MKRIVLACVVALVAQAPPAQASDRPLAAAAPSATRTAAPAVAPEVVADAAAAAIAAPQMLTAPLTMLPPPAGVVAKRSPMLLAMYAATGMLHAYDGFSTIKGVAAGQVELNPMMAPMAKHPALVIAAEAAMAAATIAAAENLWRNHHRGQAIAMLIVSNGLMAAVGANNARILRGSR